MTLLTVKVAEQLGQPQQTQLLKDLETLLFQESLRFPHRA
jgi:hypothetical protein